MSMSEFIMTRKMLEKMQARIDSVSSDEEPLNYSHQISDISTFGKDSYVVNQNNAVIWDELAFKSNYLFGHSAIHDVVYNRLTEENIDRLYMYSGYLGRQLNNFHSTERYRTGDADDVFAGITVDGYNKLEDKMRWGFQRHADRKLMYLNLAQASTPSGIKNKVSYDNDGNGNYILNGTASATTTLTWSSPIKVKKGHKYQLSGCFPNVPTEDAPQIWSLFLHSTKLNKSFVFDSKGHVDDGYPADYIVATQEMADSDDLRLLTKFTTGAKFVDATFAPQFVEIPDGDDIDISTLEWTSYDRFTKELPTPAFTSGTTSNGITITDNNDGSYTVSGVCENAEARFLLGTMNLVEGSILMGCPNGGSSATFYIEATNSASGVIKCDYSEGVRIDQTLDYDIAIVVKVGVAIEDEFRPTVRTKIGYRMFGKKKIGQWLNDVYGIGVSADCTLETIVGNQAVWDKVLVSEPCMVMLTSSDTALDYMANSLVALERFADAIYYAGQNGKAISVIANHNDLINTVVKDEASMAWIANNEDAMKTILSYESFTQRAVESEVAMSAFANSQTAMTLLMLYAANNQINQNSFTSIDDFLASMNNEIAKISQVVDSAPQSQTVLATKAMIQSTVAMLDRVTKDSKILDSNVTAIVENATFCQQAFSNQNIMDIILASKNLLFGLYNHIGKVRTHLLASNVFWERAKLSPKYKAVALSSANGTGPYGYVTSGFNMATETENYGVTGYSMKVYTKNIKALILGMSQSSKSADTVACPTQRIYNTIAQSSPVTLNSSSTYKSGESNSGITTPVHYPPAYKMADCVSSMNFRLYDINLVVHYLDLS